MASLIGHFTFVFLLRRPCLLVFCAIYQFIQRAGVRRRSLWNYVRRELQAASGLLVLAFSDLSLQVQQQVLLACPQGWAAHAREWPLQEVERQLAWNERWHFKSTEGQPARSRALKNSNEQSDLDGHWTIELDFPEIDLRCSHLHLRSCLKEDGARTENQYTKKKRVPCISTQDARRADA